MQLLTRSEFKRIVLTRAKGFCVVPDCKNHAVDAHHILNRNLFLGKNEQGGYFEANGAGLCGLHHLESEQTRISTIDLYRWCGIANPAIPEHLDSETEYDTWGNIVVSKFERIAGELFLDEGCQKALKAGQVLWIVHT